MSKITTKDCVDFLVKCASEFHPTMADTHETPAEYAALSTVMKKLSSHAMLTNPKMWKRIKKFSPKGYWDKIGVGEDNNSWEYYNPPIRGKDIQSIRWFSNGPTMTDAMDFIADDEMVYLPCGGFPGHSERHIYEVYEMKDGTLILGDNFGD